MASPGFRNARRAAAVTSAVAFIAASCVIEERPYREDCEEYCELLDRKCGDDQYQQYDRRQTCMAVCSLMTPGYDEMRGDETNTLRCRLDLLRQGDFEPSQCRAAGPGGNGVCGSDCEALCALRDGACGDVTPGDYGIGDRDECVRGCGVLRNDPGLSADVDEAGDTLQCRLIHVSDAAIDREYAEDHCWHSQILPDGRNGNPCSDPVEQPKSEDCGVYCSIVMTACQGPHQLYTDPSECQRVCGVLDRGGLNDFTENTLRCRRYHAYSAVKDPVEHCTHAGPTGDGHCGADNCYAHCQVLKQACPTEFVARHGGASAPEDLGDCELACSALPDARRDGFKDEPPYGVNQELPPGTLRCRTLHAARALALPDDPNECPAAFGDPGSPCG